MGTLIDFLLALSIRLNKYFIIYAIFLLFVHFTLAMCLYYITFALFFHAIIIIFTSDINTNSLSNSNIV